jgi:hypothetical protein
MPFNAVYLTNGLRPLQCFLTPSFDICTIHVAGSSENRQDCNPGIMGRYGCILATLLTSFVLLRMDQQALRPAAKMQTNARSANERQAVEHHSKHRDSALSPQRLTVP